MRLIFMGYSDIGHICLKVLIDLCRQFHDDIVAVVTHEDNPREQIWFESVKDLAEDHNLPVYTPADPNEPAFVELLRSLAPDFLFSCYYRLMLKQPVLDLAKMGALNLHGSLLPRYRGRCPLNWVLVHGEPLTGVTLHYMETKPDCGDIVAQAQVPIAPEDTALSLSAKNDPGGGGTAAPYLPPAPDGGGPQDPPGSQPGQLFWRSDAGGRPYRLAAGRGADLQSYPGRHPSVSRGLYQLAGQKNISLGRQS